MSILMRFIRATSRWLVISTFVSTEVIAHHGPVVNVDLYLAENLVELDGEITEVLWRNPHVRLRLSVLNEVAQEAIWELELGPAPREFNRMGVSAEFVQRGDHVTAAGYISRRNTASLGVLHLLLPSGQELVMGNREKRWPSERGLDVSYRPATTDQADPAKVEAAERAAESIFRVWGSAGIQRLADYEHLLTERARDLAATYDPVTENPELDCQQGMPNTMFDPVPMEFIDNGDYFLLHAQEYDIERIIVMDAVDDQNQQRSRLGYSVGHWEDDTLVVTTTDVDWPYFDQYGTPQSEQASYMERFSVSDDGTVLSYSLTTTDPIMFSEPFTLERSREWVPGVELELYDCVAGWGDER